MEIQTELNAEIMFGRDPPEVVYHYTRQAGLIGTVTSSTLWAHDIRHMNDELEFEYTVGLIAEILDDPAFSAELADIPDLIEIWRRALTVVTKIRVYAISFSELGDDLSQWRAYGFEGGYSIGFHALGIRSDIKVGGVQAFLFGCVYDRDAQRLQLRRALQRMSEAFRARRPAQQEVEEAHYGAMFAGHVLNVAAVYKHPCFSAEREWRLVIRPDMYHVEAGVLKFRPGKRNILPYVELPFAKNHLKSLIVGPTPHPHTAAAAGRALLRAHGFDDAISRNSDLPYRDW